MAKNNKMSNNGDIRVKALREERGLTQEELALKSGLSPSYISKLEKGFYTKGPREETLVKLARGLGISHTTLRHLIYGQLAVAHKETPEEILEKLRLIAPVSVPVYRDFPFEAGESMEPEEYVYISRPPGTPRNIEAYIVPESHLRPEIQDRDIVIVDRQGQVSSGYYAAFLKKGQLHIARVRRTGEKVWLENQEGRIRLEDCELVVPVIAVQRSLV